MDHPPIPPNCNYFRMYAPSFYHDGKPIGRRLIPEPAPGEPALASFEIQSEEADLDFYCGHPDFPIPASWRPVIAAVARCAWLDESRRLTEIARGAGSNSPEWSSADAAFENSEAWRKWGQQ